MIASDQEKFDLTIGRLDRIISELMCWKRQNLDIANKQTLKHHAEDMRAAAISIIDSLDKNIEGTPQP